MFNLTVVITRPPHQAHALQQLLSLNKIPSFLFPTVNIVLAKTSAFSSYVQTIDRYGAVIFQSANAAESLSQLPVTNQAQWPSIFAVGPATAKAVKTFCYLDAKIPKKYSSEGLLALDALQSLNPKKALIFCGQNPRPLLRDTLHAQGVSVDEAFCYSRERILASSNQKSMLLQLPNPLLVCTSRDCLNSLWETFTAEERLQLKKLPLLVISAALQKHAERLGFSHITQAHNATNEAILKGIQNLNPSP